jgi:hypothetical protein
VRSAHADVNRSLDTITTIGATAIDGQEGRKSGSVHHAERKLIVRLVKRTEPLQGGCDWNIAPSCELFELLCRLCLQNALANIPSQKKRRRKKNEGSNAS